MAVDTAGKRFSMIGFGGPVPQMVVIPDGTIGAPDRADLLYLYSGITLAAIAASAILTGPPRLLSTRIQGNEVCVTLTGATWIEGV